MSSKRIAVTVVGAIVLVVLTYAAWMWFNPIRDTEARVFRQAASGLVLLLVFRLFMPGWLVVFLIASTMTTAWTVYIQQKYDDSMSIIGSVLIFGFTAAGGAAVLWLISAVRSAWRTNRRKPLAD